MKLDCKLMESEKGFKIEIECSEFSREDFIAFKERMNKLNTKESIGGLMCGLSTIDFLEGILIWITSTNNPSAIGKTIQDIRAFFATTVAMGFIKNKDNG